jgi:hypothetical protein
MTKTSAALQPPPSLGINVAYRPKTDILTLIKKATEEAKRTKLPVVIPNYPVTREAATDIKTLNVKNRPISEIRVATLRAKMVAGEFLQNGGTFSFDKDMHQLDGQHRNEAIWESGIPQHVTLICGLDREVMPTIDTGKKRTAADALALEGYTNPSILAAAVRLVLLMKKGAVAGRVTNNRVDNQDVSNFLKDTTQRVKLEGFVHEAISALHKKAKFLTPGQWAALYYTLNERSKEGAKTFIEGLAKGENLNANNTSTSAIYHLLQKLRNLKPSEKKRGKKLMRLNSSDMLMYKFLHIYKGWNLFRAQRRVSDLVLTKEEEESIMLPTLSK